MTPRELFGMLLKLLGVWLIVTGLQNVPAIVSFALMRPEAVSTSETILGFSFTFVPLIAGCFLVFYTDWFVAIAYFNAEKPEATSMKPTELFAVFVKALGVWQIAIGLQRLPSSFERMRPYENEGEFVRMILNSFAAPGIYFVVGAFLLFGTNWLMRIAFPRHSHSEHPPDDASTAQV
jgi:hypothetical protein